MSAFRRRTRIAGRNAIFLVDRGWGRLSLILTKIALIAYVLSSTYAAFIILTENVLPMEPLLDPEATGWVAILVLASTIAVGALTSFISIKYIYPVVREDIFPLEGRDHFHGSEMRFGPRQLLVNGDRIVGFDTHRPVRCYFCRSVFSGKIRVAPGSFRYILKRVVSGLGLPLELEEAKRLTGQRRVLIEKLREYGVRFKIVRTTLFHQFYSLGYDRASRTVVFYRPPEELEDLTDVKEVVISIADRAERGDENREILLIAVMIRMNFEVGYMIVESHRFITSTCLLGFMKNGTIWLHQTPHNLPLSVEDHLAWAMGLEPGDLVIEPDREMETVWWYRDRRWEELWDDTWDPEDEGG